MTIATRPPFADADPVEVRQALLGEQRAQFDREYQYALQVAAECLSLDQLRVVLSAWRRIAALTQHDPQAYRRMRETAEYTLRTGQPRAGAVSWSELKQELGF